MRRSHNGRKMFAALGMMLALGGSTQAIAATGINSTNTKQSQKEVATLDRGVRITPVSTRNKFGGFSGESNPFKHHRKGLMNQRQLRKHLRSNPHQRAKYGK